MDLRDTPAEARFRAEVRAWLAANLPEGWGTPACPEPADAAGGYAPGVTLRWLWGDVKRFLYILQGPPPGYPGRYPTVWQGLGELFGRQPAGTRLEAWAPDDRWPAVGEWVQGIGELANGRR